MFGQRPKNRNDSQMKRSNSQEPGGGNVKSVTKKKMRKKKILEANPMKIDLTGVVQAQGVQGNQGVKNAWIDASNTYVDAKTKGIDDLKLRELRRKLRSYKKEVAKEKKEWRKDGKATTPKEFGLLTTAAKAVKKAAEEYQTKQGVSPSTDQLIKAEKELESDFEGAGNRMAERMAKATDAGDLVMINENHTTLHGFVHAKKVIDNAQKSGVLMLEAPYSLNFVPDIQSSLLAWQSKDALRGPYSDLAKYAMDKGWSVVAVDSTAFTGRNDVDALEASQLPGVDDSKDIQKTLAGKVRQNYIARNVQDELIDAGGGALLLIGGLHITGKSDDGVAPLSQMLTGLGSATSKPSNVEEVKDTNIMGQIVDQFAIKPDIDYIKPSPKSGGLIKARPTFDKLAPRVQQLLEEELKKSKGRKTGAVKTIARHNKIDQKALNNILSEFEDEFEE